MKTILVNCLSREQRIAVLEKEQLQHIHLMNKYEESLVGNVYVARVDKIMPGMDAAFVHFGREKKGFLHKDDILAVASKGKETPISQLVKQGEKILVQVIRDETEHKGARVTGFVEIATSSMVYMPHQKYIAVSKKLPHPIRERWKQLGEEYRIEDEGMLIRTEMSERDEASFVQELQNCRESYQQLVKKMSNVKAPALLKQQDRLLEAIATEMKNSSGTVYVDDFSVFQQLQMQPQSSWEYVLFREKENIFVAWDVEHQIERLKKRVVWLDNGSFLVIEEGEAMTTIDVNTGKFTGKQNKENTVGKTNMIAAKEAMRQIKLRNLSGMILIDFINMKSNKEQIIQIVKRSMKQDETTIQIIGFTELGILQLTRKVTSPSLLNYSTEICPSCGGTGRVESAQAAAFRMERELLQHRNSDYTSVVIELTKDVLQWFLGENSIYKDKLEQDVGLKIEFSVIENDKPHFYIKTYYSN
ncbi:Rne/Rng family ribonuclease [Bacillus massiliigorillae]|uniref:Rne/Rng family ribonuclease n=1 Tax=Bacillus massiliigorillae TaxID=1243664 RepID=UPI000693D554|nr:Rne/Rng family ribonuclease [Bacillus massiliigorillae]